MKIQVMSDLHCEFYNDNGARMLDDMPSVGDVLVVAGDLAPGRLLADALGWLCYKFPKIVFVPGNHEYYHSDREKMNILRKELEERHQNLIWLDQEVVEIDGQRFVGATGWFPNDPHSWMYAAQLNDFRLISGFKKWNYQVHDQTRQFLLENVRPGDVVVTHHAPTSISTPDRFRGSQLNRFYVSKFHDVIEKCQPKLWIHGHMHDPTDHEVMGCRVVSNPRGYPRHGEGANFNPELIVKV